VDFLFEALTFRPPTVEESDSYLGIVQDAIAKVGKEDGAFLGLSSIFLDRDALFRPELAATGKPDANGRVMLRDWELGLAVHHALCHIKPDETLRQAITSGRMRTRADAQREVTRMLDDDSLRKPQILRFFREYFDHDLAGYVCKDTRALAATGVSNRASVYYHDMFGATASTDRLIELVLEEDKDVLKQLLTTQKVVVAPSDKFYYGRLNTPEEVKAATDAKAKADAEQDQKEETELAAMKAEISQLTAALKAEPSDKKTRTKLDQRKKLLASMENRFREAKAARKRSDGVNVKVTAAEFSGPEIFARVSRRSFGAQSLTPERILSTAPEGQRLGILTHPAWLISHSDAMDNHAIHRGRWIRERLLGGGIPDVPITVNAMLPDEPENTLRTRMRVTKETYCWTCHEKMDPLGLPFEMYNHVGFFRTLDHDQPVDTSGEIIDSGDPALDGPVTDALDLIAKLAANERVEQVFIRHAFRFWMGRNETLNDAPVLQAAWHAYHDNGGSMKALITSLVTSDAFLYRKVERGNKTAAQ
ncbi:MAG: DUF1588 domain-containing protein, partial [Verrucomicrobiales bacterium]|nr:DUF1588 domain-containing protein [Verrucomicrobiales bacterium]